MRLAGGMIECPLNTHQYLLVDTCCSDQEHAVLQATNNALSNVKICERPKVHGQVYCKYTQVRNLLLHIIAGITAFWIDSVN